MKNFLAFTTVLLSALAVHAVSRIGGGKVSSVDSGFEIKVAQPFLGLDQLQDIIMANGPIGFNNNQLVSQFILIKEFSVQFEDLKNESRESIKDFFRKASWTSILSTNPCVEAFTYTNDSTTGTAMTWGDGKGIILQGPATPMVEQAIEETRQSAALVPGACAWK
jgi:hypothetical protein